MTILVKKIVPIKILSGTTRTGKSYYKVELKDPLFGQNFVTCWDTDFVKTLELNKEVEISYKISQTGKYTNIVILTPRDFRNSETVDSIKKLWDKIDNFERLVLKRFDDIDGKLLIKDKDLENE
jgi:hypothetical protein